MSEMAMGAMHTEGSARSQPFGRVGVIDDDFARATAPFRGELLAHCYRMLGSVHDAEDLVQETYLRAWRSYGSFEGRSSTRTWLYRIATNACLTARASRERRTVLFGVHASAEDRYRRPGSSGWRNEWSQPAPDSLLCTDPAAIVAARLRTRLAVVAALQHLPARQCAVLILRDVLQWRAGEVAELLSTTTVAVNSALQRARAHLELIAPAEDEMSDSPERRALLDRYVAAVENADTEALIGLLSEDAVWGMPPLSNWLVGRDTIRQYVMLRCPGYPGDNLLVPTSANGQPAFASYLRDQDGVYQAHALTVLSVTAAGISEIVSYQDPDLFATFGLEAQASRGLPDLPSAD
jgi:RNA polymerase sigma-70 factor (ECF subfamily)